MPFVYRVETKSGYGFYHGYDKKDGFESFGEKYKRLRNYHKNRENFPNIYTDNLEFGSKYLCACNSVCSFLHWFGTEIDNLSMDFNIFRIEVESFILGDSKKQCVFNKKDIIKKELINHIWQPQEKS